jgi:uncharacterized protein YecE (DUF72 family)
VRTALGSKNITVCYPDYPGLPNAIEQNTSIGYIRFHGVPKLFYSKYTTEELTAIKYQIDELSFREVYVYFNNTASTAGIVNAIEFLKLTK